jgi:hypothetical protein
MGGITAAPWNLLVSDDGGMRGVAPAGGCAVGGAGGTGRGGGDEAEGCGAGRMAGVLWRDSLNGAPQNLQNCADGSLAPRHRPHTRGAVDGGADGRSSTMGVGAMGSDEAMGGGLGGVTTGAVRGFELVGSTRFPQETQKRVPGSFEAPQRGQRRVVVGPSRLATAETWGFGCGGPGGSMRVGGRSP